MRGIPLKLISIFKIHTHIYISSKKKKYSWTNFLKKEKKKRYLWRAFCILFIRFVEQKKKKKKVTECQCRKWKIERIVFIRFTSRSANKELRNFPLPLPPSFIFVNSTCKEINRESKGSQEDRRDNVFVSPPFEKRRGQFYSSPRPTTTSLYTSSSHFYPLKKSSRYFSPSLLTKKRNKKENYFFSRHLNNALL